MLKAILTALALTGLVAAGAVFAAPLAPKPAVTVPVAPATTDDAKKMKAKDCIAQADKQGLHGKPRKAFKHKCKMAA